MVTDQKTPNRLYPLPYSTNKLKDDVERIRSALGLTDADVNTLLTSVAGRALLVHTHGIADITNLQAALDGKAATVHSHTLDSLSNVSTAGKANGQVLLWQSPNWIPVALQLGNVTGLEAALNARPTTTAMDAAILASKNSILNGAGAALDTLLELAAALGNDPNFATTMTTALNARVLTTTYTTGMATKANLTGDTFTGTVRVKRGTVGQSGVQLVAGTTTLPGYLEFLNDSGVSQGYIGFGSGGRFLMHTQNSMSGWSIIGDLVASGNIQAFSDERLKTNVTRIEHALETLLRGEGVMYDRDGKRQTGVIAQKLYTAIPELVLKPDDPNEMWAVNYQQALGYIIESFRDVAGMIDGLRKEIAELKKG